MRMHGDQRKISLRSCAHAHSYVAAMATLQNRPAHVVRQKLMSMSTDDSPLTSSLELSQARKRRHRSTRKGRTEDERAPQLGARDEEREKLTDRAGEEERGGEEDAASSVQSGPAVSTSARPVC